MIDSAYAKSLLPRIKRMAHNRLVRLVCGALGLAFLIAYLLGGFRGGRPAAVDRHAKYWHGWEKVEYMFVFGDSFSSTGFDPFGAQPNEDNPFGNPPFPDGVEAGGPNWVHFITATYNKSHVRTYNFANGGGTVDRRIVAPFFDYSRSLNQQVPEVFLPVYATPGSRGSEFPKWEAHNTLFVLFYGVNDISMSTRKHAGTTPNAQIFASYSGSIEMLYLAGARNFLFLNTPPLDRAPQGMDVPASAADIVDWNQRLADLRKDLTKTYTDISTFLFDFYGLFDQLLEQPQNFEQTKGIKNMTEFCLEYFMGSPEWYTVVPDCGVPINEYFWQNDLHPTWPIHNATAEILVADCFGSRTPKRHCS